MSEAGPGPTRHGELVLGDAEPREAFALTALSLRSKGYWGYSPAFMDACRDELRITPEEIENGPVAYTVAREAGRLVGFYGLLISAPGCSQLDALFVEPNHIGTGVGRALIGHAIHKAAGQGARRLLIQGDPHAEGFYRAVGGKLTGRSESLSLPGRFLPVFEMPVTPGQSLHRPRAGAA